MNNDLLTNLVNCINYMQSYISLAHCFLLFVQSYHQNMQFAPIGLIKMYNSGGAIESVDFNGDLSPCCLSIKGKGCGLFGAYSSIQPKNCTVNSKAEEFMFNPDNNLLTLTIPTSSGARWEVCVYFQV